jgi:hypothetical protein
MLLAAAAALVVLELQQRLPYQLGRLLLLQLGWALHQEEMEITVFLVQ